MKRTPWFYFFAVGIPVALAYLLFWPVDIVPQAWTPPVAKPWSQFPSTSPLAPLEIIPTGIFGRGPEDLLFDESESLYTTMESGDIIRYSPGNTVPVRFAETGGRPLGMAWGPGNHLYVTDAYKGLLQINDVGEVTVLAPTDLATGLTFANELAISADSIVYFTCSSNRSGPAAFTKDLIEHAPRGSIWAFDLKTKELNLLRDSLNYANGLVLWPDGNSLIFAETSQYRLMRYWIRGPKKGQLETWVTNLPGFPDNLSWGTNNTLWVALPNPRNATLDKILPYPFLRKIVYRLPTAVQPKATRNAIVAGFDTLGQMKMCFRDTSGHFGMVTSAVEQKGHLYIGSLSENGFGIWEIAPE